MADANDTLTSEQIAEQIEELRSCEGVGLRQVGLFDRFQDAASTIEKLQNRAENAEAERDTLSKIVQEADSRIDYWTCLAADWERRAKAAKAERDRYREMAVRLAKGSFSLRNTLVSLGVGDPQVTDPDIAALLAEEN